MVEYRWFAVGILMMYVILSEILVLPVIWPPSWIYGIHRCPVTSAVPLLTRKLCYRKDDRAMRPTYGCPENFRDIRPRPLFPTFSWAFVPIDPVIVPTKFEIRSFTRS